MRDKLIAWLLRKTDRILIILWFPLGGSLGSYDWWPDWAYRIHFVSYSWMISVQRWAEDHGWYDCMGSEFRRLTPSERAESSS
jgi:hypothetical protein